MKWGKFVFYAILWGKLVFFAIVLPYSIIYGGQFTGGGIDCSRCEPITILKQLASVFHVNSEPQRMGTKILKERHYVISRYLVIVYTWLYTTRDFVS